ncbi:VanZ family protein [Microbacterium sp. LWH12-1.2]|uniref:VanZ family protein n=1 Tax=Microbacterium sp. LWH12-1.2 TaxID=3135259 RepID=UPI00344387DD
MSILTIERTEQEVAPPRSRVPLAAATIAYTALVAAITLGPQGAVGSFREIIERVVGSVPFPFLPISPFLSLSLSVPSLDFQVAANVLMFVPFGMLAALWFRHASWLVLATIGFAVSAAVEATQLFLPGRVTDVSDLIANTVGMVLGSLIVMAARNSYEPRPVFPSSS